MQTNYKTKPKSNDHKIPFLQSLNIHVSVQSLPGSQIGKISEPDDFKGPKRERGKSEKKRIREKK